ncbi:MAG: glycine reductase, partial [Oscillospiraceae bacterium]|nr:glycine reductase [Oscillospiraceae bacterium]
MKSILKGTSYILAHTPDMVIHDGTTQTTERIVNPDSEYLKLLPSHIRSYEQALSYYPNQVYIGNKTPEELRAIPMPWYDKSCDCCLRYGKFGEIMPQEEFLLLMQACDVFDLVKLSSSFVEANKASLGKSELIDESILNRISGCDILEIEQNVENASASPLYHNNELIGCVMRAHDIDVNLSAHVMLENLVSKASSVLALLHAVKNAGLNKGDIDYVIDCCEEACGDMNQRGGG